MKIKVEDNDDSNESAIDDLCDKHGDDYADSNDARLSETGGDDFQWLFKMLATMGTLMRTIRMVRMMGMMGMMVYDDHDGDCDDGDDIKGHYDY